MGVLGSEPLTPKAPIGECSFTHGWPFFMRIRQCINSHTSLETHADRLGLTDFLFLKPEENPNFNPCPENVLRPLAF